MRLLRLSSFAIAGALVLCPLADVGASPAAPARATPVERQTKAMLEKVVARVKADRQQAFLEFTGRKPPFFEHGRYVVCIDSHLVVVAHGGFATYVGSAGFFKDLNGKLMPPVIWEAGTKGNGVVRYALRDDETNNRLERKIGFFQRIDDDVCGVVARVP